MKTVSIKTLFFYSKSYGILLKRIKDNIWQNINENIFEWNITELYLLKNKFVNKNRNYL